MQTLDLYVWDVGPGLVEVSKTRPYGAQLNLFVHEIMTPMPINPPLGRMPSQQFDTWLTNLPPGTKLNMHQVGSLGAVSARSPGVDAS
jgi:hypothetical protein